ncbi:uncharacterized protein LOC6575274 [Drosophila mojavensis]|uniref:Uncharacterized protein n=1 Tax=Drosophila mojavensis TaxID=7230 RepID=B4KA73_DROMO|nr:uncharacterized protein LOC6575274 [Drosophila mojavensis]EDW16748.1 uncharacterized protein Dmoj_GI10704 [Drosophila mojavensis]
MSKKKNRTGTKTEAMDLGSTALASKPNIANTAYNNDASMDRLAGLEDLAQFDSSGMPFILVDGVCVRNRHQLHIALSKREKKCMKRIKRQCAVLPWLEHTRPAYDTEPLTEAEKDAQDELNFQADLQLLQLDMLKGEEKSPEPQETDSHTPIAHAVSTEDLSPNLSRIEEIRIQLERLREQQQNEPDEPESVLEQLRIRRQATFDIERDAPISESASSLSLDLQTPISLPQTESRPSLQKMYSSTCLSGKSTSNVLLGRSCSRSDSFPTQKSADSPIDSKIEDLLMHPEKRSHNPGPYSYVVTVSPKPVAKRCKVEPIGLAKTRSLMLPAAAPGYVSDKIVREQTDDFVAESTTLQNKSRTFLKVPRLFKKLKK